MDHTTHPKKPSTRELMVNSTMAGSISDVRRRDNDTRLPFSSMGRIYTISAGQLRLPIPIVACNSQLRRLSSAVEHSFRKAGVQGSNP